MEDFENSGNACRWWGGDESKNQISRISGSRRRHCLWSAHKWSYIHIVRMQNVSMCIRGVQSCTMNPRMLRSRDSSEWRSFLAYDVFRHIKSFGSIFNWTGMYFGHWSFAFRLARQSRFCTTCSTGGTALQGAELSHCQVSSCQVLGLGAARC